MPRLSLQHVVRYASREDQTQDTRTNQNSEQRAGSRCLPERNSEPRVSFIRDGDRLLDQKKHLQQDQQPLQEHQRP